MDMEQSESERGGVKEPEEGDELDRMDALDEALRSVKVLDLLRRFLALQRRRAEAYTKLRRLCDLERGWGLFSCRGFSEYMSKGGEEAYQQLCGEITHEFNDCSKQVIDLESMLMLPDVCRPDLANLLKSVQAQEKQKLHLTVKIQVLKKSGRPSERLVMHDSCRLDNRGHQCVHVCEITEAAGTEDAEADAEYESALKDAICGVQEAVTCINDYMEEVRYEIEALESD